MRKSRATKAKRLGACALCGDRTHGVRVCLECAKRTDLLPDEPAVAPTPSSLTESIAAASVTGPATNIIAGFAVALECTALPTFTIGAAIIVSHILAAGTWLFLRLARPPIEGYILGNYYILACVISLGGLIGPPLLRVDVFAALSLLSVPAFEDVGL